MMGMTPRSLFGMMQPTQAPMQDVAPAAAFQWGQGGSRLTPDMIAQRSRMAQGLIAAGTDTSPVGHWTQGLARVAQALIGKRQQAKLDQAATANADYERQILASLTAAGGNDQASLAAMASPYLTDGTRDALKLQWQATHKTAPQPSEFERTLMAAGIQPGTPQWAQANTQRLQNYTDPTVNIPLPGGRVYVGPRSGISAATGGGDPASTAPAGEGPPAMLPPDFDFGGPTQNASGGFR